MKHIRNCNLFLDYSFKKYMIIFGFSVLAVRELQSRYG